MTHEQYPQGRGGGTPLLRYLAVVLVIILPVLGFYLGSVYTSGKSMVSEGVPTGVDLGDYEIVSPEIGDLGEGGTVAGQTFPIDDFEVGISFLYPASWGSISFDDEPAVCEKEAGVVCNFRTYSFESVASGSIFLAAETRGHHENPVGRGAFWGDMAGRIGPDYLTVCQSAPNCEIITNENGLALAHYEADPPPEEQGYLPERYYIYNPDSQYYGLILSPHRLTNSEYVITSEDFRNTVIETFAFLEE